MSATDGGPARSGLGALWAFEGIDGCGKSTQLARLLAQLEAHAPESRPVILREPGGTPVGERLRELLLHSEAHELCAESEVLLLMASRAELVRQRVAPLREDGRHVLLDRSWYSTAAYQGGGSGVDAAHIEALARRVLGEHQPQRVVLLDVPPAQAAARRAAQGDDRIEARGAAYFEAVAAAYRRYAAREPERFVVIDGARDPDTVHREVLERLGVGR